MKGQSTVAHQNSPESAVRWTNWSKNQSFAPEAIRTPVSETDVGEIVRQARREGFSVRAAGSGHSFTPVVETTGILLDTSRLSGVVDADHATRTARIRGGTRLADIGEPLWRAGLSLKNQGDTDGQTLAGATATGTKGSGTAFGSISSCIKGMRLVSGTGEIVTIDGSDSELLHAAQVSLGLLGVVTELTMDCAPAFRLQEANTVMTLDELMEAWDGSPDAYRHFSFFWAPTERSAALYGIPELGADQAWVKFLTEIPAEPGSADDAVAVTGGFGDRNGRAYVVFPDIPDDQAPGFVELEYMVERRNGRDAFLALRRLMLEDHPDAISPVQVRWQRADEALLSPGHGRDSVSISVSGEGNKDFHPFLRAVDRELHKFDARPHWGKMHYLRNDQVSAAYPRLDSFLRIRQQFDPDGIFLTRHFRDLFGIA